MKDLISIGDARRDKDDNMAFKFKEVEIPSNAIGISFFHRHDWVTASVGWLEPIKDEVSHGEA